ncbi:L,D-transpeptidase [Cetobacterium sp. 8H]|uniref:L,D-transpeptidase n=1 Tax=Cetobacterium sp. 8H TaxID=2759681 RepID=UPI00163CD8CC|nr:L,D-transpeptidase [Cetobacterium sp. 8H]MBC2851757.1 L,D-transpeptidase [Cetobacterium sp. 8H]
MEIRKLFIGIVSIMFFTTLSAAIIEKDLTYNKYTLPDRYKYGKTEREFQWDKISILLDELEEFETQNIRFGTLKNYKNVNGLPPVARQIGMEKYSDGSRPTVKDKFGNRRSQGIPLYIEGMMDRPERYAPDGSLISIVSIGPEYVKLRVEAFDGEWLVPIRYVKEIGAKSFSRVVVIDRKNQNIATLEDVGSVWKIRSMNPASTGLDRPPYQLPTPLGIFVVQSKLNKMDYLKDGSRTEIEGYAPYATRFSGGGYIHGVPVNLPRTQMIEYSPTLGTVPRSHMCVRNATSHAKYVYGWAQVGKGLVFVIE